MIRESDKKPALFVIDLQEGFVNETTEKTACDVKSLVDANIFDPIIFTRFRNTENSPHSLILGWKRMFDEEEFALWSGIIDRSSIVIDKSRYTAVNDEVLKLIEEEKIGVAYLVGLDTDCCVLTTAVNLFEEGIRAVVLADYCASNGGDSSHSAGLTALRRLIGNDNVVHGKGDVAIREIVGSYRKLVE